jgi:hypothetical protein
VKVDSEPCDVVSKLYCCRDNVDRCLSKMVTGTASRVFRNVSEFARQPSRYDCLRANCLSAARLARRDRDAMVSSLPCPPPPRGRSQARLLLSLFEHCCPRNRYPSRLPSPQHYSVENPACMSLSPRPASRLTIIPTQIQCTTSRFL